MPSIERRQGPIAVTGASGFVGAHIVRALLARGHDVRACVTDAGNPEKTAHLLVLNEAGSPGEVALHEANLLESGSYDAAFDGCVGVVHAATAMAYANENRPQQIYDAAVNGTRNVIDAVRKVGSVRRIVYTSSFSAIHHPAPAGYVFSEDDWASDGREDNPVWNLENLDDKGETAYEIGKVESEKMLYREADEDGGFDAMAINPLVILGPLLARNHELVFSWQWAVGRMLRGKPNIRGWQHLWNIVDVRDVASAHALALESTSASNGDRFMLCATDDSAIMDVRELQARLQALFPDIDVGGAPDEMKAALGPDGRIFDAPRAYCHKARRELGLETHPVEDTLRETGRTLIELGLIEPKLRQGG